MTWSLEIGGPADLVHVFGILGHAVGPRTGPGIRTHDEKEWWCLRRYIFTLSAAGQLEFPISSRRESALIFAAGSVRALSASK